jgi:hypothetical protein
MKTSNLYKLIEQYLTAQISDLETEKFEFMLDAIKERDIHWVSDETEELLFQKLKDSSIAPEEIAAFVKSWSKLHLSDVEWVKFKGMDVYFSKEAY